MPFGQLNVAIQIYNICKGRLGSRGERGCISERRHQISDNKQTTLQDGRFLLYINCINSFTVHSVIRQLVPLFNGLVPIYVTEKQVQLMIEINSHSIRSRFFSCIKEIPF